MSRYKKAGDLAYGYRLQYRKQGDHLLSHVVYWRRKKDGPPPEWDQVKKDPQMVWGRLFKRGRIIDSF